MLKHQFFHRAKKVPISDQELKAIKNKKAKKSNDTDKDEKKKVDKKKKDKKDDESEETSKDDKNEDDKNKCAEVRSILYLSVIKFECMSQLRYKLTNIIYRLKGYLYMY